MPSEQFADGFQFEATFRGGLGIFHLQVVECIKDNLEDNQPGIFLVIGGNEAPGRLPGFRQVLTVFIDALLLLKADLAA